MLRLGELLGAEVVDASGARLGKVHDVRLVQDGPLIEGFGQALRLDGLVVGEGSIGIRLGFIRHEIAGPWLLRSLARRRERSARYVPWPSVAALDDGRISLSVSAQELGPVR